MVVLLGLVGLTAWLTVMSLSPGWLHYYPYVPYSPWPTFNPSIGAILLLLAVPGMLLPPEEGADALPSDDVPKAITPA